MVTTVVTGITRTLSVGVRRSHGERLDHLLVAVPSLVVPRYVGDHSLRRSRLAAHAFVTHVLLLYEGCQVPAHGGVDFRQRFGWVNRIQGTLAVGFLFAEDILTRWRTIEHGKVVWTSELITYNRLD